MNRIFVVFSLLILWSASMAQEADSTLKATPDSSDDSPSVQHDTIAGQLNTPDSITSLDRVNDTLIRKEDSTANKAIPDKGFDLQYYHTISDSASVDSSTIHYFTLRNEWFYPTQLQLTDTSLRYFHYTNPLYHQENIYQSLGNTGLAAKNMVYTPATTSGFQYGTETFDIYTINEHTLRFYNTLSPYSNIYYKSGPDKEQLLNFTHSQSIYKTVTIGMDVRIINSVGAFLNQKSQDRRVGITGHYISDNKRYTSAAFYAHNKFDIKENGGIANREVFENNEETDRLIYDIHLADANNLTKDATLYYKHSFELSPTKASADSAEMIKKTPFNFGRISHTFKYYRQAFNFKENYNQNNAPLELYDNFYQDTLRTHDSTYYHTIENRFSWKNSRLFRTRKSLGFDFGVTHRLINFQDSTKQFKYNQITFHGKVSKTLYDDLKIGGEAEYVQGDINENDFRLSGVLENKFGDALHLRAAVDQISREPSYIFRHYYSNHFRWDHSFKKENIIKAGGEVRWKNHKAGGNYFLLTNYTFLNSQAEPQQAGKSFSILQAYLFPSFQFGHVNWDSYIYLQKASDDSFMRLPFAAGKTTIAYHGHLFDRALYFQTGINVMYKDLYYADQYMPALRSFYNQDSQKIGNFFYGDVYVSIKIKRTRLLLKYRHVNEGFTAYKYYDTPNYPMKDGGIEFSLSWRFHD